MAPRSEDARAALDAYLAAHPVVGEAPLIPATNDPSQPAHKMVALYRLRRAEKLAALLRLEQGGYHAFRRRRASERRRLPVHDVMAAGGWRSAEVMQTAYQHADAATTLAVVQLRATEPPRHSRAKRATKAGG